MQVNVIKHPLIEHKITQLRKEETGTSEFRQIVNEIAMFMTYEITRDFKLEYSEIKTPITTAKCGQIGGKKLAVVPILRAGLGMVDGIIELIPTAKVGHIGLYRDEKTLEIIEYFSKFPDSMESRDVLLVDPMLATGASAVAAINILKKQGAKHIKLVCLVGAPEGVIKVNENHPDVEIFLATLDEGLNEKSYIVPGLGDAGDRIFGTK